MPLFRTQSAAKQTSLAPHDSKARLQNGHDSQGFMAKPCTPHLHCAARAVIQAANCQCRGSRGPPLAFSWGFKGDILSRERISPFPRAAPPALLFPLRPVGAKSGISPFGEMKMVTNCNFYENVNSKCEKNIKKYNQASRANSSRHSANTISAVFQPNISRG